MQVAKPTSIMYYVKLFREYGMNKLQNLTYAFTQQHCRLGFGKSICLKLSDEHGYLSGMKFRCFAYGPANATATW